MSAQSNPTAATGAALADGEIGPDLLRDWLEAIEVVDVEANFRFADDGVHVGIVNPSRTVQLETTLFPQAFEEYFHAGGDTEHERLAFVEDIRRTAKLTDTDAEETVSIHVDGPSDPVTVCAGPIQRTVATYDLDSYVAPEPLDRDPDYAAAIERSDIQYATNASAIPFSHHRDGDVRFYAHDDGSLELVADGDTDRIEAAIPTLDVIQAPDMRVSAAFGRELLTDVVTTIPDGAAVAFQFSQDDPFVLRWSLEEEIHGEATVVAAATYTVAPRDGGDA